jgi:hypothetical protein
VQLTDNKRFSCGHESIDYSISLVGSFTLHYKFSADNVATPILVVVVVDTL